MKPDLSIDVIRFAAPSVVKLNLYWSGNQSVLRGWARKDGIPGLYIDKGKKLTTLVLHACPVSSLPAREGFPPSHVSAVYHDPQVSLAIFILNRNRITP